MSIKERGIKEARIKRLQFTSKKEQMLQVKKEEVLQEWKEGRQLNCNRSV